MKIKLLVIGDLIKGGSWDRPQRGCVYFPPPMGLSSALDTCDGVVVALPCAVRGRGGRQRLEPGFRPWANTLTSVAKDMMVLEIHHV